MGRPKGVPNKSTMAARTAIAAFVEGNSERLNDWLDQIAEDSPKAAFECFMSVVEYHIPKLARQEVTGLNGGAIETKDTTSVKDYARRVAFMLAQESANTAENKEKTP